MPTPKVAISLARLYAFDGAPWCYPAWQERTGVLWGLNPADDTQLPKGFSREQAEHIVAYLKKLSGFPKEDDRNKFAKADSREDHAMWPGRRLFNDWVGKNIGGAWKVHKDIDAVLNQNGLSPIQIMADEQDFKHHPVSDSHLPAVLDKIGLMLYGEEALTSARRLPMRLRLPTQLIASKTWVNLSRRAGTLSHRYPEYKGGALASFENLENDELTKAKLISCIKSLNKWEEAAKKCAFEEDILLVESMIEDVRQMMAELGSNAAKNKAGDMKSKSVSATKISKLKHLPQEDVEDLLLEYETYMTNQDDLDRETLDTSSEDLVVPRKKDCKDVGVEYESTMSRSKLLRELNFTFGGLPFVFNKGLFTCGATLWDDPLPPKGTMRKSINLHTYQLAAVHAVARNVFSKEPIATHGNGVLIADEVGLGKTFQSLCVIGFYMEVYVRQISNAANVQVPPIIKARPYLRGQEVVPNLPHLILVPGTILPQWQHEIKVLFQKSKVALLVYPQSVSGRANFWMEGGTYRSCTTQKHQIIILATHSSLTLEYGKLYTSTRGEHLNPWDYGEPWKGHDTEILGTLFGIEYGVIILDESQNFRNMGPKHCAALRILEQATIRINLTATPLQTSTKDLAAAGRLTNIPYFFTDNLADQLRQDDADLRRARKEKASSKVPLKECPVEKLQTAISERFQERFEGRVIRRTGESLDSEGKPLVDIPEMVIIHAQVKLTDREYDIIEDYIANNKALMDSASSGGASRSFYIDLRLNVGFARTKAEKKQHPRVPRFNSLTEWESVKSTKIDIAVRMCKHILTSDLAPTVSFVDGAPIFPEIPVDPVAPVMRTNKIIIYQEFSSLASVLKNILDLYGLQYVAIDGQTPFEKRGDIIRRFTNSTLINIMILSKVGGVGVNASAANNIIFIDQPWSAQDERQIRGRAHRQPQERVVTCYHLLAAETADVTLSSMALSKKTMLESFLSRPGAKKVADDLNGVTGDDGDLNGATGSEGEDDNQDAEEGGGGEKPSVPRTLKKKKSRAKDTAAKTGEESEIAQKKRSSHKKSNVTGVEANDGVRQTDPRRKKKGSLRVKSQAVVSESDEEENGGIANGGNTQEIGTGGGAQPVSHDTGTRNDSKWTGLRSLSHELVQSASHPTSRAPRRSMILSVPNSNTRELMDRNENAHSGGGGENGAELFTNQWGSQEGDYPMRDPSDDDEFDHQPHLEDNDPMDLDRRSDHEMDLDGLQKRSDDEEEYPMEGVQDIAPHLSKKRLRSDSADAQVFIDAAKARDRTHPQSKKVKPLPVTEETATVRTRGDSRMPGNHVGSVSEPRLSAEAAQAALLERRQASIAGRTPQGQQPEKPTPKPRNSSTQTANAFKLTGADNGSTSSGGQHAKPGSRHGQEMAQQRRITSTNEELSLSEPRQAGSSQSSTRPSISRLPERRRAEMAETSSTQQANLPTRAPKPSVARNLSEKEIYERRVPESAVGRPRSLEWTGPPITTTKPAPKIANPHRPGNTNTGASSSSTMGGNSKGKMGSGARNGSMG